MDAKIVDFDGSELPPGEVGELLLKTNRMMKGYYQNPDLTHKTLKNDWLHTGDLVKTDEEGYYYIVDRAKDMVTSGGENIFPVEIEDALMDHPKIDDVACIGYPDERLVEIVLAIVQLKRRGVHDRGGIDRIRQIQDGHIQGAAQSHFRSGHAKPDRQTHEAQNEREIYRPQGSV